MYKKAEIVLTNFNLFTGKCYEDFLKSKVKIHSIDKDIEYDESELYSYLNKEIQKWTSIPIEEIEGLNPIEFFQSLGNLDDHIQIFKIGSKICDEDLPDLFLNKLREHGEAAVDRLIELATDRELMSDYDEKYAIPLMAIKTLGKWKDEKIAPILIDLLIKIDEDNELFKEEIKEALVNIGEGALTPILNSINSSVEITDAQEYLLMALSEIGQRRKSDFVYSCLKNTFLKMKNKVLGAICLAGYGDGRAIPVLRGYIQKDISNIDKDTFGEILWAIESLGGETKDLKQFVPGL